MNVIPNPECVNNKHANCDRTGLDLDSDQFVALGCPCACHEENK